MVNGWNSGYRVKWEPGGYGERLNRGYFVKWWPLVYGGIMTIAANQGHNNVNG